MITPEQNDKIEQHKKTVKRVSHSHEKNKYRLALVTQFEWTRSVVSCFLFFFSFSFFKEKKIFSVIGEETIEAKLMTENRPSAPTKDKTKEQWGKTTPVTLTLTVTKTTIVIIKIRDRQKWKRVEGRRK